MSSISFFNSLPKKGQAHTASGIMTVDDFILGVKHGKWQQQVEVIRNESDPDRRSQLKKGLLSVTISGTFMERKEANLLTHSGFICIDVDNYTDKSRIVADKYTYACFYSASKSGFAVIVKVNPDKHKDSFRWLQKYYFENFGIVVDSAPQNVASLRYASFDQEVEINTKSHQAKTNVEKRVKPKTLAIYVPEDKVGGYVKEAQERGLNIAPGYQDYLHLSFALVDGFGESGRDFFHILCQNSDKYDSRHANKQYDIAIKRGKSGITVGTFYFMLKQAGIEIKNESGPAVSIAAMGKKSGREQAAVVEQLITINNIDPDAARKIVEDVYEREDINLRELNKDPEQLIFSIVKFLEMNHDLKRNQITRAIEDNKEELRKELINTIYLRARCFFNTTDVTFDLIERIIFSEHTKNYHPITDYIEANLIKHNSTGNIDTIIKTVETDTPGAEIFIRKWLLSIIASYKGYPVRSFLAFTGEQYTGKSEWFRRLLPEALSRYYGETKFDNGKDDELLMTQKLILQDDEMSGKTREDEKRIKELLSKNIFSLRPPYGRANEDFKRLALLCGTSNDKNILNDRTGNTRFLPVNVISVNQELYNSVNKDELFMELFRTFEDGELEFKNGNPNGPNNWRFTRSEFESLAAVSKDFETVNYESELIFRFFKPKSDCDPIELLKLEFMTATDMKDFIERSSKQQIRNMKSFGVELRKIFGGSRNLKKEGGRVYEVLKIENPTAPESTPIIQSNVKINEPSAINTADDEEEELPF